MYKTCRSIKVDLFYRKHVNYVHFVTTKNKETHFNVKAKKKNMIISQQELKINIIKLLY